MNLFLVWHFRVDLYLTFFPPQENNAQALKKMYKETHAHIDACIYLHKNERIRNWEKIHKCLRKELIKDIFPK